MHRQIGILSNLIVFALATDHLDPFCNKPYWCAWNKDPNTVCKVDFEQTRTCGAPGSNNYANFHLRDPEGKAWYDSQDPFDNIADDPTPFTVQTANMKRPFVAISIADDQVQLYYGDNHWIAAMDNQETIGDGGMCVLVGDDHWTGDIPEGCPGAAPLKRSFECAFDCS